MSLRDIVTRQILRKMYYDGYVGARHTSVDNLQKGFPKHERGNANDAAQKLIRQNLIIPKSTSYGKHCSLNHNEIKEIKRLIGV